VPPASLPTFSKRVQDGVITLQQSFCYSSYFHAPNFCHRRGMHYISLLAVRLRACNIFSSACLVHTFRCRVGSGQVRCTYGSFTLALLSSWYFAAVVFCAMRHFVSDSVRSATYLPFTLLTCLYTFILLLSAGTLFLARFAARVLAPPTLGSPHSSLWFCTIYLLVCLVWFSGSVSFGYARGYASAFMRSGFIYLHLLLLPSCSHHMV